MERISFRFVSLYPIHWLKLLGRRASVGFLSLAHFFTFLRALCELKLVSSTRVHFAECRGGSSNGTWARSINWDQRHKNRRSGTRVKQCWCKDAILLQEKLGRSSFFRDLRTVELESFWKYFRDVWGVSEHFYVFTSSALIAMGIPRIPESLPENQITFIYIHICSCWLLQPSPE